MVKYSGEKVLAKPTTLRAPPCPAHSAAYACIPAARHLVTGYSHLSSLRAGFEPRIPPVCVTLVPCAVCGLPTYTMRSEGTVRSSPPPGEGL